VVALALVALVALLAPVPSADEPADAAVAETIGCSQAGVRTVLTADAELDPSCTYTAGFEITASGVTLDCRGAAIAGPAGVGGAGILVHAPTDVALADVVVQGCDVSGFTNAIKVTRDGFRTLPDGGEFEHPFSNIELRDNVVHDTGGVGIFVDGYVTGVAIRGNEVRSTGSSGIYLETGSKQTLVEGNVIRDNGFVENGPGGRPFDLGGTTVWFWGVGREGISVDGSYENTIRGNRFSGNSAGHVLLYKNCGEYPDRNPGRWFERRDPADRNLIEGNEFVGGRNGVWVGSRMGENTLPMECSDPAYVDEPGRRIVLDRAADNVIRANRFVDVTYGVRVEDDGTQVIDNAFTGTGPDRHAIVVGTPYRTEVLGRPVTGTVLRGNQADIDGNDSPYRWVHGHVGTTDVDNLALGAPATLCEGRPLPRQLFVMVIAVAPALPDGSEPPTPDLTVETVGALPSCRVDALPPSSTSTTSPGPAADPVAATPPPARPVPGAAAYTG
jgi:parallel beta-helix repeat protein